MIGRRARFPRPRPASGAPLARAERHVERPVGLPVQVRRGREERRVEEDHRRADLVERGRARLAQIGRSPQERDLLAKVAAHLGVVGGCQARVVQTVEQRVDRGAVPRGRSAAALPWDGLSARARCGDPPSGRRRHHPAPGRGAADHGLVEQIVEGLGRGARPAPELPHPLLLLGQVDELEVDREGAGERWRSRRPRATRAPRPARPGPTGSPSRRSAMVRAGPVRRARGRARPPAPRGPGRGAPRAAEPRE